ncbi:aminomethyl-transferring glycine dehydrogenase subunit GcvPA [bacterium]|nr:aminomethyl-transferring glycine dehydrogenase subunit GcvPA [bacterium]
MLKEIGASSVEALFADIPSDELLGRPLGLPASLSEPDLVALMKQLAAQNASADDLTYLLGAGCYSHYIPSVIDHVLTRSEFYTAYTPYQPELSQGTLQVMFEFQTMICQLTGMDVTNASMYDCSTAVAEAAMMAGRILRKRSKILICRTAHPEYRAVTKGYLARIGMDYEEVGFDTDGRIDRAELAGKLDDSVAGVIVQSPNFFGVIEEIAIVADAAHEAGALLIDAISEPLSLGILKPPGEQGADIVVGQAQSLGIPMSFGGPHLGFFACRQKFMRQMPGRLSGRTVDHDGRPGFVMTLATREQHIRRARATSNICTNHQLCALAAAVYMTLMGKEGMRELASLNLLKADYAKKQLAQRGMQPLFTGPTFNEFPVGLPRPAASVNEALLEKKIVGGLPLNRFYPEFDEKAMLVCFTEFSSAEAIDTFCEEVTR